jgi:retron-type reverse transcriptase
MKIARELFERMTALDHIFQCWGEFRRGKRKRKDIQAFERHLEDNLFQLQEELSSLQYQHQPYDRFYITDPKQRHISKASVKDRLVHQAVYNILSEVLEPKFIFHSFSSRPEKGTHIAVAHLRRMIQKVSKNGKQPCFALKMDIKRFFDTINHQILKTLLRKYIADDRALNLIDTIIDGFRTCTGTSGFKGIPLGNVTSQLFANVYLHELDDFIKQSLREKYYLRYCDDFIILSENKQHLKNLILVIREFLMNTLQLELHPKKVGIRKLIQGIDFVGYVLFERYTLVRTRTKQRMKRRLQKGHKSYLSGKIDAASMDQQVQSYLGILSHANQHDLSEAIKNAYWVRDENGEISAF